MGGESIKRRRRKLHDQHDGKCFWCGCVTVLCEDATYNEDDLATLDHIRNRIGKKMNNSLNNITVLACKRCNNLRGKYEDAFYFAIDPANKPNQPHPYSDEMVVLHNRLSNGILAFLDKGGTLEVEDKNASKWRSRILGWCIRLRQLRVMK